MLVAVLTAACVSSAPDGRPPPAGSGPASDCGPADDHGCLSRRQADLVRRHGAEAVFAELDRRPALEPGLCHHLVHEIGRAVAQRYGSLPSAFAHGDPRCGGGYFHGVVDAVVAASDPVEIGRAADAFCGEIRVAQPFGHDHMHCSHGLGHGLMSASGNDLGRALELCDTLSSERERQTCYSGVFMQKMMVSYDDRSPGGFDAGRPLSPCTELADRYASQCFQRQTTFLLSTVDGSFAAAFDRCGGLPARTRTPCNQGLGRDAAQQELTEGSARPDLIAAHCSAAPDDDARSDCTIGAVKALIRFRSDVAEAVTFCARTDGTRRATCDRVVEVYRTRADS